MVLAFVASGLDRVEHGGLARTFGVVDGDEGDLGLGIDVDFGDVDGTHGPAVVGLRKCWAQSLCTTPKPVWNPDIPQPIDFFAGWQEVPDATVYDNAFKIQWELFLRHVALDESFPYDLMEGAKGVQLACGVGRRGGRSNWSASLDGVKSSP